MNIIVDNNTTSLDANKNGNLPAKIDNSALYSAVNRELSKSGLDKLNADARILVSETVRKVKSAISTGNGAEADKLLSEATIALLGDEGVDVNSNEFKNIKAALQQSIAKLETPVVRLAANGDPATSTEANLLPDGVKGGYHAGTNTILLSQDHAKTGDPKAVSETVGEEVSEAIVADVEKSTGQSFKGDAGDRLSSVFSGKDAKQAIDGEAAGKVDVPARLNGRDVEVAAKTPSLRFEHDKPAHILGPDEMGQHDHVNFKVVVPHKGSEDHARVAADVATQVANWIEGRIASGAANGGPKLSKGGEAFGDDPDNLVGSVKDYSDNNKVQTLLKNVYDMIYTISKTTYNSHSDQDQIELDLTIKDEKISIDKLKITASTNRKVALFIFGANTGSSSHHFTLDEDFGQIDEDSGKLLRQSGGAEMLLQKIFQFRQTGDNRRLGYGNVTQEALDEGVPWRQALSDSENSIKNTSFGLGGPQSNVRPEESDEGVDLSVGGQMDPRKIKQVESSKEEPSPPAEPGADDTDDSSSAPGSQKPKQPEFQGGGISGLAAVTQPGASSGSRGFITKVIDGVSTAIFASSPGTIPAEVVTADSVQYGDLTVTTASAAEFASGVGISFGEGLELGEAIASIALVPGDPDDPDYDGDGQITGNGLFKKLKEKGFSDGILEKLFNYLTKAYQTGIPSFIKYLYDTDFGRSIYSDLLYIGSTVGPQLTELFGQKNEYTFNAMAKHGIGGKVLFQPEEGTDASPWKNDEDGEALSRILNNKTTRSALQQMAAIFEPGSKHREAFFTTVFGDLSAEEETQIETFYTDMHNLVAGDDPVSNEAVKAFLDKNNMHFGIFGGKDTGLSGFFDPILRRVGIASNVFELADQTNFASAGVLATTFLEEMTHSIASKLGITEESTNSATDVGRAAVNYLSSADLSVMKQGADRVPTEDEVRRSQGADKKDVFTTPEGNEAHAVFRIGATQSNKLIVEIRGDVKGQEQDPPFGASDDKIQKIYRGSFRLEYRLSRASLDTSGVDFVMPYDGQFKIVTTAAVRVPFDDPLHKKMSAYFFPDIEDKPNQPGTGRKIDRKSQFGVDLSFEAGFKKENPTFLGLSLSTSAIFKSVPYVGKWKWLDLAGDMLGPVKGKVVGTVEAHDRSKFRSFFIKGDFNIRINANGQLNGVNFSEISGQNKLFRPLKPFDVENPYPGPLSSEEIKRSQYYQYTGKIEGKLGFAVPAGGYIGVGDDLDAAD